MTENAPSIFAGAVLALSGGTGSAKLVQGLDAVLPPGQLVVFANTADDFEHMGLSMAPDLDTLLYTLADVHDEERGWGRRDDTWSFMETLEAIGGETWYRLGDRTLAVNAERSGRLARGETLSQVTDYLRRKFNVRSRLLPMSDDRVRTRIRTTTGWLDFPDYFIRQRATPVLGEIAFAGIEQAKAHPGLLRALRAPDLRAVVICPSNPLVSIAPILALSGVRDALRGCKAPVIAVSPIVGGQVVRGPTAKMMHELGFGASVDGVVRRYTGLINAMIVDHGDAKASTATRLVTAPMHMRTLDDRQALANTLLRLADDIAKTKRAR